MNNNMNNRMNHITSVHHPIVAQNSRTCFRALELTPEEFIEFSERYRNTNLSTSSEGEQGLLAKQIEKSILLKRKMRERLAKKKSKDNSKK